MRLNLLFLEHAGLAGRKSFVFIFFTEVAKYTFEGGWGLDPYNMERIDKELAGAIDNCEVMDRRVVNLIYTHGVEELIAVEYEATIKFFEFKQSLVSLLHYSIRTLFLFARQLGHFMSTLRFLDYSR